MNSTMSKNARDTMTAMSDAGHKISNMASNVATTIRSSHGVPSDNGNGNRIVPSPSNDYDSDSSYEGEEDNEGNIDSPSARTTVMSHTGIAGLSTTPRISSHKTAGVQGQFDLCGTMYKRRGGLGRNAEIKWVLRCFTLYGHILCYHEESKLENVDDPSNPRARLNLQKTETIAEMHSKHKPGLPTEHLLTINIYDAFRAKRKWEMCCTSKEQQMVWYNAISAYDGKPSDDGVGTGGEGGGRVSGVAIGGTERSYSFDHPELLSPTEKAELKHSNSDVSVHDTLLMPAFSNDSASGKRPSSRGSIVAFDDVDLIAKAAAKAAKILNEEQQQQKNVLTPETVVLIIVVLNVASYCVRNGSEQTYKMTLFFMNVFVLYIALQHSGPKSKPPPRKSPAARAAKAKKQKAESEGKESKPGALEKTKSFVKSLPVGKTIPRASPKKDSISYKTMQSHGANSEEFIRAYAATPLNDIEIKPHSYGNVDPKTFNLRVGPNYKKNKQKAPSGPALYDLYSMDFIYADTSLKNAADKFRIPTIPGITDVSTGHGHIPPMLIINTWLPAEEPSMFAKNTDGETYTAVMVFVLSKDTLEQLKNIDKASPGVKLMSEYFLRADKEADFKGRLKCMGIVEDIESTGVPKFIHGYNGKPALVTKSGTFKRHDNYIEMSINVHMWAYLAKKGLYTLAPRFPDFVVNIGFTIEARKDDEMPEVLLGGCRLMNLDPEKAIVDGVDDENM